MKKRHKQILLAVFFILLVLVLYYHNFFVREFESIKPGLWIPLTLFWIPILLYVGIGLSKWVLLSAVFSAFLFEIIKFGWSHPSGFEKVMLVLLLLLVIINASQKLKLYREKKKGIIRICR